MERSRPPVERHSGYRMLELPVQWILDDWPSFGYENGYHGQIADPDNVAEFDGLHAEGRHFVLTMPPEVFGRPHRLAMLDRLIAHIRRRGDVWWAAAEVVARQCAPAQLG